MHRPYNFAPGPAALPLEVLRRAQTELLDYENTGLSVMEMSHRSPQFADIIGDAEHTLRELMGIPDAYVVLFLQGGASLQFSMVPLNLLPEGKHAEYLNTGSWSTKAIAEARRVGPVKVVASGQEEGFTRVPPTSREDFDPEAAYVHITTNNTIYGTRFSRLPDVKEAPLVADVSSHILSEPLEVSRFGLMYAGAQKNVGPAGLTVVIVRKDLIGKADERVPTMLDYRTHAEKASLFNTPPCYAIYIAGLVFRWLQDLGGIEAMARINGKKAHILYDFLDSSRLFSANIEGEYRSLMNVTFKLPDDGLTAAFLSQAEKAGFLSLQGHRSVGGMRASLYNAVTVQAVSDLVDFMAAFEKENA